MTTFTDAEVQSKLSAVLERATTDGEVRIRRPDGTEFILRPAARSPLDVGYIKTAKPVSLDDILDSIREGNERA